MIRKRILVKGAVQGVGFRPFIYNLAASHALGGFVLNEPEGVRIEVEGNESSVEAFVDEIGSSAPPMARVTDIQCEAIALAGERTFAIRHSGGAGTRIVLIPPDLATCEDCLRELSDPRDRRYQYPFINCTNCGPRYTIIKAMPYDRAQTTMASFEMCPDCRAEYEDPTNRRFHAEPTCCPACGPKMSLMDPSGSDLASDDPIGEAKRRFARGEVLAIKGLGGFHLACDAGNESAVQRLRSRKHRDVKPFALMVRDVDAARNLVHGAAGNDAVDMALLASPQRPIVLMPKLSGHGLAEGVAPRSAEFGIMLPYTPLHHMLMDGQFDALVMTSGNFTDEPIAHTNEEALAQLGPMVDAILAHDRDIHIRTDDSVMRVTAGGPQFLRRSRGYAPFPIDIPVDTTGKEILAVGPELNNTVCLTRADGAFLSHHLGDLNNLAAYEGFLQAIDHMESVLDVTPKAIACDLHPGYLSTRYSRERGLPLVKVQHHHAHVASVMVEAGLTERVIGVSYDGMGWGEDDSPWGGEFMVADLGEFQRMAHLEPVAQPGGDAAAKRPPRMAYAYLHAALGEEAATISAKLMPEFAETEMPTIEQVIARGVNCPLTSSMGRLFDAASAVLGVCSYNSFHAQAPMELQAAAEQASAEQGTYEVAIRQAQSGASIVRTSQLIEQLALDFMSGTAVEVCAARFHNSVVELTLDICRQIRENMGLKTVALSGGVFANAFLTDRLVLSLERADFRTLLNREAPPGDGGISLGQAAAAAWRQSCV